MTSAAAATLSVRDVLLQSAAGAAAGRMDDIAYLGTDIGMYLMADLPVLEDWPTEVIPVHMLYAPNRYLNATVRVFIDWAAALLERNQDLRRI